MVTDITNNSRIIHGFGGYPEATVTQSTPRNIAQLKQALQQTTCIARGNGQSYGDAAHADCMLSTTHFNHMLAFDAEAGLLTVESGVQLSCILKHFVPHGWFLPVTPGTKHITVGGAIAADVHGKNHHHAGCLSAYVQSLDIMLANGDIKTCTPHNNTELFQATCGGMGLTGIILQATIALKRTPSSMIEQTTRRTDSLDGTLTTLEDVRQHDYVVAWLDLTHKKYSGRGHVLIGEHTDKGNLTYNAPHEKKRPFKLFQLATHPTIATHLNNQLYHTVKQKHSSACVTLNDFFYPLDRYANWPALYGRAGMLQYQCVVPMQDADRHLHALLDTIKTHRCTPILSVLKHLGAKNHNNLSFPMEGLTLAVDFKVTPTLRPLFNALNQQVADCGGRVYLAKDAWLTPSQFERMYGDSLAAFKAYKTKVDPHNRFTSHLWQRLTLPHTAP